MNWPFASYTSSKAWICGKSSASMAANSAYAAVWAEAREAASRTTASTTLSTTLSRNTGSLRIRLFGNNRSLAILWRAGEESFVAVLRFSRRGIIRIYWLASLGLACQTHVGQRPGRLGVGHDDAVQ